MAEASIAQQHPVDVWKALLASLGIIGTLVSVLYYRLNKDLSEHDAKLEKGSQSFIEIGEKLVSIGEKIAHLQVSKTELGEDLSDIEEEIKALTARLTILETEHNSCIPRKLSMRGMTDDH